MEGSAKRRLSASRKKKTKSDVFYFNQLAEPAYSTNKEQNAQYQSKRQCQQVLKQMPQLIM